jgi:hypothetical protein
LRDTLAMDSSTVTRHDDRGRYELDVDDEVLAFAELWALVNLLSAVLAVAGAAYITDTLAHLVLVDYARYADVLLAMVAVPSVVAELWFTVWLLTSARRLPERRIVESVLEPA